MCSASGQQQARSQLKNETACLHQEASAGLDETGKFRKGGETGAMQAPAVQGETSELRRETEAQTSAVPGGTVDIPRETSDLLREEEMQAGEG